MSNETIALIGVLIFASPLMLTLFLCTVSMCVTLIKEIWEELRR